MPKISVIMPVYNQRTDYLRDAIESILGQTFTDFEFIIVDDGSSDNEVSKTLELYAKKDRRIRLMKNERNSGIVYSLNRGLDTATGEYIARMDSDDISLPDRLEKQLAYLEQHEQCALVGSWVDVIDESGKKIGSIRPGTESDAIENTILQENPIIHPTWMFRKSLITEVGGYNPDTINTEDYEFLLRIARNHRLANIPEILLRYRFNTNGLSFGKNKVQEKNALKIRIRALQKYGYPKWQIIHLLRPAFFYLFIPSFLKKIFLEISFKIP